MMATPSPTSSSFTPSAPPPKHSPNSHPYAIKSSSSAILTRSASSPNRTATQHHFVPLITTTASSSSPKNNRYVVSRKHSYPAVGVTPAPIPAPDIPPTPPLTVRAKRRDTDPTIGCGSVTDVEGNALPTNPKFWTPTQLATYLSSALRLKGDAKLPTPVARDIAAFVVKERLSGRSFLRMTKEDYDSLGINTLWKSVLSDASRTLRQNLVRGRIMGFGNEPFTSSLDDLSLIMNEEDDDLQLSRNPVQNTSPSSTRSSSSYTPWDRKRTLGRLKAGRIRGMIENLERSSSESGSGSEGEWGGTWKGKGSESGNENGDEEADVEALYPGLTDGSGSLVSEDGTMFDAGEMSVPLTTVTSTSTPEFFVQPESSADKLVLSPATLPDSFITIKPDILESLATVKSTTVPSSAAMDFDIDPSPEAGCEPSIETLLLTEPPKPEAGLQPPSWGAKAWEADELHTTAKRVPLSDNFVSGARVGADGMENDGVVRQEGSVKPGNGSRKVKKVEALTGLFERPTDGGLRDSGIEDNKEKETKDDAEGKAANKPGLEMEAINHEHEVEAAETLAQPTPPFCEFVLEPIPTAEKDGPEVEVTSMDHAGPLQPLEVSELPPVSDAVSTSPPQLPIETFPESEELVLDHPTLPADENAPIPPAPVALDTIPSSSSLTEKPTVPGLVSLARSTSELQATLIKVQERLKAVEDRLELEARDAEREAELQPEQRDETGRATTRRTVEQQDKTKTESHEYIFASDVDSPANYASPDPLLGELPEFVLLAFLGIASVVVGSLIGWGKRRAK